MTYIKARDIEEGQSIYYLSEMRVIEKVTPRFNFVELHFTEVGSWMIEKDEWVHVEL